jgi:tRNA(fMet)-specific endonuclease VapC
VKYMLDTNILIYLLKHRPPAVAVRLDALDADDTVCMSIITFAEMLGGAERSSRKPEAVRRLEQLTRLIPVAYPSGSSICLHYAEQFTRLRTTGTPIRANDLWVGCPALAESATLVTNNEREFRRLAGLAVENWAAA